MKELVKKITTAFSRGGYDLHKIFEEGSQVCLGNPWALLYVHKNRSAQVAYRVITPPHHAVNMAFLLRSVVGIENLQVLPSFINKDGNPIQINE